MFGRKPMETMILRAEDSDLQRMSEIHAACFSRGWSTVELQKMFVQPTMTFLVARAVGKPREPVLGFNIYRQTAEEAEIISIAVDPARRGLNIGMELMRDSIRRLASDRIPALLLEVDEGNSGAVSLYRKLGFQQVGTRPAYYEPDEQIGETDERQKAAALVMRLDLG